MTKPLFVSVHTASATRYGPQYAERVPQPLAEVALPMPKVVSTAMPADSTTTEKVKAAIKKHGNVDTSTLEGNTFEFGYQFKLTSTIENRARGPRRTGVPESRKDEQDHEAGEPLKGLWTLGFGKEEQVKRSDAPRRSYVAMHALRTTVDPRD